MPNNEHTTQEAQGSEYKKTVENYREQNTKHEMKAKKTSVWLNIFKGSVIGGTEVAIDHPVLCDLIL